MREADLPPFRWTDPVLLAGVTPVTLVRLIALVQRVLRVLDAYA